jgi:hypothetical protein
LFRATSIILTLAPGTAAPFGSTTRPLILPRSSWAPADASRNVNTKIVAAIASNTCLIGVTLNFIFPSPLFGLPAVCGSYSSARQFSLAPRKLTECNQIISVNQKNLKTEELDCAVLKRLVRPIG